MSLAPNWPPMYNTIRINGTGLHSMIEAYSMDRTGVKMESFTQPGDTNTAAAVASSNLSNRYTSIDSQPGQVSSGMVKRCLAMDVQVQWWDDKGTLINK